MKDFIKKFKEELIANKKKFVILLFLGAAAGGGTFMGFKYIRAQVKMHDDHKAQSDEAHAPKGFVQKVLSLYDWAWTSSWHKIYDLQEAVEKSERLEIENANLRRWAEMLRFDCSALDSLRKTREIELRLDAEAGARIGRTLASIQYRAPGHLMPNEQYTLGVSYFKGREYEKAAVIFSMLTGLDGFDEFKTPENFLVTGVAWYHLDHLKEAGMYFEKVLAIESDKEVLPYHAQARLWSALVADRKGGRSKAQGWLKELLDYHPHSEQVDWINGFSGNRKPSSTQPGKAQKHETTHETKKDLGHESHS